jgi:hypothetical protein
MALSQQLRQAWGTPATYALQEEEEEEEEEEGEEEEEEPMVREGRLPVSDLERDLSRRGCFFGASRSARSFITTAGAYTSC